MPIVTEKSSLREQPRSKVKGLLPLIAMATAIAVGTVVFIRSHQNQNQTAPTPTVSTQPVVNKIVALGRLEPQGEVIALSAPSTDQGARIAQVLVEEGDWVKAGQVVAVLDSRDRLQAALTNAQTQVKVAQANLATVQAGAQTGEIEAQQAAVARLEAQLQGQQTTLQATIARQSAEQRNAQSDYDRYQSLYQEGAISTQELQTRRLTAETTREQVNESIATRNETIATLQRQIDEARATLNKITEIRPTDVQVAQAQVEQASAVVKQAQADLALSYVKAPTSGEIIKIHTQPGEVANSTDGIAEIGRTNQMIVVAEVLEENISKVRLGQHATIASQNQAFEGTLKGTVTQVGRQIGKQNVLDSDPAADVDARVVEVRISLPPETSQRVSGLTYAKTIVEINV